MLQIVQKQNTQDNKKPKFTKCPKLQINVQNYKMSKITNVQVYKISQVTTFWFFCTFFYVHLTWSITFLTRS